MAGGMDRCDVQGDMARAWMSSVGTEQKLKMRIDFIAAAKMKHLRWIADRISVVYVFKPSGAAVEVEAPSDPFLPVV